jgi:hypothetical protein
VLIKTYKAISPKTYHEATIKKQKWHSEATDNPFLESKKNSQKKGKKKKPKL